MPPKSRSAKSRIASSSKTRKSVSKKAKSARSSVKSRRSSINIEPKMAVFQQTYSYSSNPMPGMPYGHLTRMMFSNGKGKKMEANLNRHGVPINVKQSPVSTKRLNM